jgi:hypothetical protein
MDFFDLPSVMERRQAIAIPARANSQRRSPTRSPAGSPVAHTSARCWIAFELPSSVLFWREEIHPDKQRCQIFSPIAVQSYIKAVINVF